MLRASFSVLDSLARLYAPSGRGRDALPRWDYAGAGWRLAFRHTSRMDFSGGTGGDRRVESSPTATASSTLISEEQHYTNGWPTRDLRSSPALKHGGLPV